MKYFSMFSGIGGFELGIQRAFDYEPCGERIIYKSNRCYDCWLEENEGEESQNEPWWSRIPASTQRDLSNTDGCWGTERGWNEQHPRCIGYSEIDKYAIKVYERHFKHENKGDATTINPKELPDFDLLVGGFPCQAFSIAGKRAGFNDTRGTLFFDIARILKEKQPRHLVLENVKGLLSHDQGRTFTTIIGVLTDLGYSVEWQVLNSKDFGVPQNRERIFIVGHLGTECRRKVFPIRGNSQQTIESGLATVSAVNGVKRVNLSPTLDTMHKKGLGSKQARPAVINQINQPTHSNDRVYGTDGVSPTLNTMQGGNRQPFIEQSPRIRRLTPLECERLQGFPDDWTAGESDTQRYKMCGNAVTVNVVEAVMERIIDHE